MLFCVSVYFMRSIGVRYGLALLISHLHLRVSFSSKRPYPAAFLLICDIIVEICERLSCLMLLTVCFSF